MTHANNAWLIRYASDLRTELAALDRSIRSKTETLTEYHERRRELAEKIQRIEERLDDGNANR